MKLQEITIRFTDLDDARHVLKMCLNYFYAKDLETAQIQLRQVSASPITKELEVLTTRFDGYLADYLLAQHESDVELETADPVPEADTEAEADEPLSDDPLSTKRMPKRKSRQITKAELENRVKDMEIKESTDADGSE